MQTDIKKQLDAFLHHSPFPWWEWDVQGNVVTSSPRKAEMLGYNHHDFIGKGYQVYTDLLHKDDFERTMQAMRDLLEGRAEIYQVDYRILAADQSYHWYMDRGAITKKNSTGAPLIVRGIVIDLGKHTASEAPVEKIVELVRAAVPSDRTSESTLDVCSSCLRVRSDGTWISISKMLTEFITLYKNHSICPDCLNRLYPELVNELTEKIRLEKLNRVKNQFLGMAVHDMRNPLNLILLYTGLLKKEIPGKLNQEQQELLGRVMDSGDFLKRIIDDFLATSVIESGQLQLNRKSTSLKEVIHQGISFIESFAKQKKITIKTVIQNAAPDAIIDKQKICQVINNLLSNAVYHGPTNSIVTIKCGIQNEEILFTVSDQGDGIPPEESAGIFDPFKRKESKNNREGGVGLGLAIAKTIVEAHHGTIWVESRPGKGASFYFSIPLSR